MKVVEVNKRDCNLVFEDGTRLYSEHERECCEIHELDFEHITLDDFDGLEFDLSTDNFLERVKDFGIRLIPTNGHPVPIPGYGYNNGYYSDQLTLILKLPNRSTRMYDITECQVVRD